MPGTRRKSNSNIAPIGSRPCQKLFLAPLRAGKSGIRGTCPNTIAGERNRLHFARALDIAVPLILDSVFLSKLEQL